MDLSDWKSSSVTTSLPAMSANSDRKHKYAVDEDGEPASKKRKCSVDKKGMKQSYLF